MTGAEWVVEAYGCNTRALCDRAQIALVFERLIRDLGLHPVGDPLWHQFPVTGGLTGMVLLSESHLACHTFPEHGSLCLNLFCCRARRDWDFRENLVEIVGAAEVRVRRLERDYGPAIVGLGAEGAA